MGGMPSVPQTGNTFYGDKGQSTPYGAELHKIETIVRQWTEIIHTHKGRHGMTAGEYRFLIYQIKETDKEWRLLIEPNQQLNESIHGPRQNKPRERKVVREPGKYAEQSPFIKQQEYNKQMEEQIKELSMKLEHEKSLHKQQTDWNRLLEDGKDKHRGQLEKIQQENKELVLRISKLASEKLLKNNPNIADLSDPNRPTQLGELYSELYDNEYKEAFASICDTGYSEREAIDTLIETLLNTFEFCSETATGILTKAEDTIRQLFYGTGPRKSRYKGTETSKCQDDIKSTLKWKPKDNNELEEKENEVKRYDNVMKTFEVKMKTLIQEIGEIMVPTIQKAYLRTRWDAKCIDQLRPFIERCIFISWLMNVQSPPMAFLQVPPTGVMEKLNGTSYRSYTKQGALIDFVVWPAMMLTKDGPIII